jgi:hypothetical protein
MRSSVAQNLYLDGRPYLRGMLGLSWLPSSAAQRNKANYEADLERIVRSIYSTFTGSQVILRIAFHRSKNVVIQPRSVGPDPNDPGQDKFSQDYNASTAPSSEVGSIRKGDDAPAPGKDATEDHTKGTGEGSDALISFNPGVYKDAMGVAPGDDDQKSKKFWAESGRSDCVLLHELVHAMSDVSGVNAQDQGAPYRYQNLEEFAAVEIANIYYAELTGAMPAILVGGHDGSVLPVQLKDSKAFYDKYKQYMQNVCDNHPELAKQLKSATGIAHNPFVYCTV